MVPWSEREKDMAWIKCIWSGRPWAATKPNLTLHAVLDEDDDGRVFDDALGSRRAISSRALSQIFNPACCQEAVRHRLDDGRR